MSTRALQYRKTTALISLALLLAATHPAAGDYVAYSVNDQQRSPLPESIDDIEAKYLINVEWSPFAGRKTRLGVLEVDNTSSATSYRVSSSSGEQYDFSAALTQVPVNGIEAIVIDVLNSTNRFRLVERTVLSNVLQEQDLGTSGRIAQPSAAKTGNVLGAQYLVQFVITSYEADTEGKKVGIGGLLRKTPLLGGVGIKNSSGSIGINARLIDAETSEIVFTKQIESAVKESGLVFGGIGGVGDVGIGGFLSNYSKTPIGQAVIAGVNEAVYALIKQIGSKPAEGTVVKADANEVFLNIGSDSVETGERLQLFAKGEELLDPETGISLGGDDEYLGDVEVTRTEEKFSVARPMSLSRTAARGDLVKSTKAPEPLEFAASWNPPGK